MLKTCRNTGFPLRYFLKPIHWCSKTWPAYHSPHCIPINTPFNPRLQWFANIDQYIPINYSISQQNITIKNRQKKTCFLVRSPDCGWLGPPNFNAMKPRKKSVQILWFSHNFHQATEKCSKCKQCEANENGDGRTTWMCLKIVIESEMFCSNTTNSRQILDYCNYCSSQWIYNGSWRYNYRVWRYTDVPWIGDINLQSRGDFVFLD